MKYDTLSYHGAFFLSIKGSMTFPENRFFEVIDVVNLYKRKIYALTIISYFISKNDSNRYAHLPCYLPIISYFISKKVTCRIIPHFSVRNHNKKQSTWRRPFTGAWVETPTTCPYRSLLSASRQPSPPGDAGLPRDGAAASGDQRTASRYRFAPACPAGSNGRCSWSRMTSGLRRDSVPAVEPRSLSAVGTGGSLPADGACGSTGLSSESKFSVPFLSAW